MLLRRAGFSLTLFAVMAGPIALADEDEGGWGSESGWEDLDDSNKTKQDEPLPPMMMAAETLPPGYLGFRASGGLLFGALGVHVGVLDWMDVIADAYMPYEDIGNTWMFGGGLKFRIHGKRSTFQYALKLKGYGVYYDDPNSASNFLPKGFGLWPSFMVGMNVKGGSFYGELGGLFFPYVTDDSNSTAIWRGMPAHFGGEIYITDYFHIFINVDILISFGWGMFSYNLTGPFNLLEVGVNFIL